MSEGARPARLAAASMRRRTSWRFPAMSARGGTLLQGVENLLGHRGVVTAEACRDGFLQGGLRFGVLVLACERQAVIEVGVRQGRAAGIHLQDLLELRFGLLDLALVPENDGRVVDGGRIAACERAGG